jgi:hypothetical protein
MAWSYTTKAIVTELYKFPEASLKDEWSTWVESLINEHMGYAYIGTSATITDEKHNGNGSSSVYVKYPPIVSVSSLAIGSVTPSTLDSTSYKVFDDHIELIYSQVTELSTAIYGGKSTFPIGVQNITITYVSGLASVPAIVQLTATQMIGEIAKFTSRGGADNSQKFTPAAQTMGQSAGVVAVRGLSSTLQSIMDLNLRKRALSLA